MKVTLSRITETQVEVEIPTSCPECGADFTENGNLTEDQYMATGQACVIVDAKEGLFDYESSDDYPEAQYVVGYRCSCGHVLASTEEKQHSTDADCERSGTLVDGVCSCGVTTGDPCADCGGRRYHEEKCAAVERGAG